MLRFGASKKCFRQACSVSEDGKKDSGKHVPFRSSKKRLPASIRRFGAQFCYVFFIHLVMYVHISNLGFIRYVSKFEITKVLCINNISSVTINKVYIQFKKTAGKSFRSINIIINYKYFKNDN